MSKSNVRVTIYPQDQDFTISIGSREVGSRTYANSSNTYRGARAAARNLIAGNITHESNYGPETLAIVNANGFVIAANEFKTAPTAKRAASEWLKNTRGMKKKEIEAEVVRD
jgi:hypothetical protein